MQGGLGFNESFLSSVADVCLGLTWRTGFFLLEIAARILCSFQENCFLCLGWVVLSSPERERI